jgi:prephenate dehydrogenase
VKPWDTVAIVGVGLIGGSIGLALRQRGLANHVVGIGRRETSLNRARAMEAVTATTTHIGQGVADAELIVVCTPVANIVDHVRQIAAHCPARALITDVGSTKQQIVAALQDDGNDRGEFIGSHPLAGSEKTGVLYADANLFVDRVTIVTPSEHSTTGAVQRITEFWRSLDSVVVNMSPESHDAGVSLTSHATHIIASALAAATGEAELPLAATGWLDTTRVAAGDPELWQQILLSNRDHVLKSLDKFAKVLTKFKAALDQNDMDQILQLLELGKKTRDSMGS